MVAELCLEIPLFASEQRHHRVAVVAVDVEGLRHHRQEPAVEIQGPAFVVRRQATGEILDIVRLPVPFSAGREKLMDGVVVADVGRLHVGADVTHPALPTLLHLFDDETAQVSVRQRFPLFEAQVVGTELRHLFHHVVTQLIATAQEVLDAAHDAFLLVHL